MIFADHVSKFSKRTLAIEGGRPVRSDPLPLEFPGVHYMDEKEIQAALRVVRSRSLFRYYGVDPQGEVGKFETEFAEFLSVPHALAVTSGTGALHVSLSALAVGHRPAHTARLLTEHFAARKCIQGAS